MSTPDTPIYKFYLYNNYYFVTLFITLTNCPAKNFARYWCRCRWLTVRNHLCISQIEASTSPPGQPPGHLNFWILACSNSLPLGQKAVQIPYQLVLKHLFSKTNFAFNLTLLMVFRERYPIMAPSNFFYRPFERDIDQQGQDSIM